MCLRAMPPEQRQETRQALQEITGTRRDEARALLRLFETIWKQADRAAEAQKGAQQ